MENLGETHNTKMPRQNKQTKNSPRRMTPNKQPMRMEMESKPKRRIQHKEQSNNTTRNYINKNLQTIFRI